MEGVVYHVTSCSHMQRFQDMQTDTSWASQDQIETQKRAGRRQFEELDAEKFTQHFYDQSGEDHWA